VTTEAILITVLIGLTAGIVGGMAGIGGSLIMLPGLAVLLGYRDETHAEHHAYMAAAMIVNIVVAVPAAVRHHRAGTVRLDLARGLLPVMIAAIIGGVVLSNKLTGEALRLFLAAFIALYCLNNLIALVRRHPEPDAGSGRPGAPALAGTGLVAGLSSGLLGIGGGVLMVPLLQVLGRVRLREAIGTSSAVMCITATIGAALKAATLGRHDQPLLWALTLALMMAPGAAVGSWAGARLTHTLPVPAVRAVVSVLLLLAAARMAGWF
jgi:uncharacterized protein